jgi:leucyl aminopeptidase
MKLSSLLLASITAASASALSLPSFKDLVGSLQTQHPFINPEEYLIQLSPGEQRWVTEEEKWQLLREGIKFFDVTEHQDTERLRSSRLSTARKVTYPAAPTQNETLSKLLEQLEKKNMRKHLETFTSCEYTRVTWATMHD